MTRGINEDDYISLQKQSKYKTKTGPNCVTLDLWLVEFIQEECRCKINDPALKYRLQQNGHREDWGDPGPEIVSSGNVRGCLVIPSRPRAYWLHHREIESLSALIKEEAPAN